MKKLIVITRPDFFPKETEAICTLFESGLSHLHIRKPGCSLAEYKSLLESIPMIYHSRVRIHEYPEIAKKWDVGGIHLNKRYPSIPADYTGRISRSCHSLEELSGGDSFDYLFLSPVFTSISKQGYAGRFPIEVLKKASENGLIRENIIALGGIDRHSIPQIQSLGFGGYAVLGAVWGKPGSILSCSEINQRFQKLQQLIR